MWREEVGITEMMLAYIGEFAEFRGWSSWRSVVIDILSCHEQIRRQRIDSKNSAEDIENFRTQSDFAEAPSQDVCTKIWKCPQIEDGETYNEKTLKNLDQVASNTISMVKQSEVELFSEIKVEDENEFISERSHVTELGLTIESNSSREGVVEFDEVRRSFGTDEISIPTFPQDTTAAPVPSLAISQLSNDSHHNETYSYAPLKCSYVTESSDNRYDAGNQTATSIDRKALHCAFCSRFFRSYSGRIAHERKHRGERPYVCKFCSKAFTHQTTKDEHEMIHTGEKPHVCRYCPKRFVQRSTRNVHEYLHTGEKRYKCRYCSEAFTFRTQKAVHERKHSIIT